MADKVERPDIVEDEHLDFLDIVRESGVTNMHGAAPYLEEEFDINIRDARKILQYWMDSFGEDDR